MFTPGTAETSEQTEPVASESIGDPFYRLVNNFITMEGVRGNPGTPFFYSLIHLRETTDCRHLTLWLPIETY